jgi:hypothetical protein
MPGKSSADSSEELDSIVGVTFAVSDLYPNGICAQAGTARIKARHDMKMRQMLPWESFKNGSRKRYYPEPETRRIWTSVSRLELGDHAVGKHIHARSENRKMSFIFLRLLGFARDQRANRG